MAKRDSLSYRKLKWRLYQNEAQIKVNSSYLYFKERNNPDPIRYKKAIVVIQLSGSLFEAWIYINDGPCPKYIQAGK